MQAKHTLMSILRYASNILVYISFNGWWVNYKVSC